MLRRGPSMKSETVALEGERQRLQLLVGELLLKNHQLRCEVARLREAFDAKGLESVCENSFPNSVPEGRLNLAQDASPGLVLKGRPVP